MVINLLSVEFFMFSGVYPAENSIILRKSRVFESKIRKKPLPSTKNVNSKFLGKKFKHKTKTSQNIINKIAKIVRQNQKLIEKHNEVLIIKTER